MRISRKVITIFIAVGIILTISSMPHQQDKQLMIEVDASNPINDRPVINHTFNLYQGWNLISIPVQHNWTAETLGQNITGCSLICMFDGNNKRFLTHMVGVPWDDFPIKDANGYWILISNDTTLTISGEQIEDISIFIYEGWNLIGWWYSDYGNITAEDLAQALYSTSLVTKWDASNQMFVSYITYKSPYNFIIVPGMAVFTYNHPPPHWWYGEI